MLLVADQALYTVYKLEDGSILKESKGLESIFEDDLLEAGRLQKLASALGISVPVLEQSSSYIKMDCWDQSIFEKVSSSSVEDLPMVFYCLGNSLGILHAQYIVHNDLHLGNIGWYKNAAIFIDWEMAIELDIEEMSIEDVNRILNDEYSYVLCGCTELGYSGLLGLTAEALHEAVSEAFLLGYEAAYKSFI